MALTLPTLAGTQNDGMKGFDESLMAELLGCIEYNITTREAWRLLRDQNGDVKTRVVLVVRAYATTWNALTSAKDSSVTFQAASTVSVERYYICNTIARGMNNLFTAAEEDFEKGLAFVREVEKGSHIKPTTISIFRTEAVLELCRLSQARLAALASH